MMHWLTRCIWFVIVVLIHENDGSWVDPDTVEADQTLTSFVDKREYKLVFSDEFNVDGRTFHDGRDPRWTAMNKDDYTNFALHYYNADLAVTTNGVLNISTIVSDVSFDTHNPEKIDQRRQTKNYQSGMINGWNKFCFTGGIVEISAKLPGKYNAGGLWPAMWLLGNLARATYVGSSNNVWPWSYDSCSKPIQSQQEFSACNEINHYNMKPHQGRGAPEIDILEAMAGVDEELPGTIIKRPYFSSSFQVAPAIQDYRPVGAMPPEPGRWYDHGLEYGDTSKTDINVFFYGMTLEGTVLSCHQLLSATITTQP